MYSSSIENPHRIGPHIISVFSTRLYVSLSSILDLLVLLLTSISSKTCLILVISSFHPLFRISSSLQVDLLSSITSQRQVRMIARRKRTDKILLSATLVFFLSWAPLNILNLVLDFQTPVEVNRNVIKKSSTQKLSFFFFCISNKKRQFNFL